MCNISMVMDKQQNPAGLSDRAVTCAEVMGYMSSKFNKDGSGGILVRPDGELFVAYSGEQLRIKRDMGWGTLITHQRLSTSGHNSENLHPHKRDGFLLMHNGVFSGLGNKDKSDTAEYCDLLQAELDKSHDMIAAIQATHKQVSGSYSVLVYVRATRQLIYYKNATTSMHMLEHPKYRLMSTSDDNIKFAKWFMQLDPAKCQEMDIKPRIIYDLTTLQELGEITDKEITYTATKISDWDDSFLGYGSYGRSYDSSYKGGFYRSLTKAEKKRWRGSDYYYDAPEPALNPGEVKRPSDEQLDEAGWRGE